MTAGRVFCISPPTDGSKSTHQTSPRSMRVRGGSVSDDAFRRLQRLPFSGVVGGHVAVRSFDILRHDVGACEFFNELADSAPADGPVKALIDGLADRNCKLTTHDSCLYELY